MTTDERNAAISEFIEGTLLPGVKQRGATDDQLELARHDVDLRLRSLAARWGDRAEVLPLLAPFLDVALWNEPQDVHPFVRALVTVGVRNSALENLHNAADVILEEDWQPLTVAAARHFAGWGRDFGDDDAGEPPADDRFAGIRARHPVSWAAFSLYEHAVAGETHEYEPPASEPWPMLEVDFEADVTHRNENVVHAMDERIDAALAEAVERVCRDDVAVFAVPSFKHISRNQQRLFRVTETVLTNGRMIVTSNSVLTPTRVRWRDKLVYYNVYPDSWRDEYAGVGRNDPCPCGSGLKFKRCHGA